MTEGAERPVDGEAPASSVSEVAATAADNASPTAGRPAGDPAAPAAADPAAAPSPPTTAPAALGDLRGLLLDDELTRSEREAAEALRTGAFEGATDTVRMRREDIPPAAIREAVPAALGAATPAPAPSLATTASEPAMPAPVPAPTAPATTAPSVPVEAAAPPPPPSSAPASPTEGSSPAASPPSSATEGHSPAAPPSAGTSTAPAAAPADAPSGATPTTAPSSPETAVPAAPALESPLAAVKRAAASGEPATATPELHVEPAAPAASAPTAPAAVAITSAAPAPSAPAAPASDETAPTEKFDRDKVHADVAKPEPAPPARATATLDAGKRDASKSSATLKAPRARTEEDDRLLGALIFLDSPSAGPERPPSPFETIAGVSLMRRAAAGVRQANVHRVVLTGASADVIERARGEFASAGFAGKLETWEPGAPFPFPERGRILILDAAGVHDPDAVARLAKWKGERACVLVADEGDGLRVQVEGGKVKEVGASLVPFDGVTCGAVNVPVSLFSRLTELGALGALVALARDGLLAASVERRTFAREITSETGLTEARQRLLDRASGGQQDALLNRWIHRRLSRPLTSVLLPMRVPPIALTLLGGLVGLLGAALLSGCGLAPSAPVLGFGVLLLIGSIVLDCTGDELAALGMRETPGRRVVGLALDGIVAVAAVLGLGYGAKLLRVDEGLTFASYAAIGVAIASLLSMVASTGDAPPAQDTVSKGVALLEARIRHRDIAYVMLVVVAAHAIQQLVSPPAANDVDGPPVLRLALVVLPALAHAFWVALAFLLVTRPRRG